MKSEREKKSITKSIKLSPNQEQFIMEQAEKKNMSFSEYMIDCAVHGNQGITPCMAVKMQEMVNIVLEIADNLDGSDYIRKEKLRQKAYDFDSLFTSVSPQEEYNKLENNIGLFVKGGAEIWEFLK